ncbi:MAG: polysaccharide biosynthesis tyrosine autokinase [Muribaculaceae bacterium]|nr:polysaccharide biosynthesis tyrosine autokinase [Muribaculaceae bacterium]
MEETIKGQTPATEPEESNLSLIDLYRQMQAKWLWYVASLGVCIVLAVFYLLAATPRYTRSTEILLKDDSSQSIGADLSMLGVNPVPSETLNEMFVMTSPQIMETVVSRLNLNNVYTTRRGLRKVELYQNSPVSVERIDSVTNADPRLSYGFKIKINDAKTGVTLSGFKSKGKRVSGDAVEAKFGQEVKTPVGTFIVKPTEFIDKPDAKGNPAPTSITYAHKTVKAAARALCELVKSEYDADNGNIITLSITEGNTKKADNILTEIVEAYNQLWIADRNKIAMATSKFIDERLMMIEEELGNVESNITQFKSSHRMLDMDAMATLYLNQSSENQKALNQLSQEIAIGRYLKSELAAGDITRLLPATADIGGTNIQTLVTEYNRAVSERNFRLETTPEESPMMRQKADAIMRTRDAILSSVDAALEALNKRYKAISLVDSNTQNKLATAPGQAKYLMSEERKQKVKESLYLFLLQRREENELSQTFTMYNTRMITEPYGKPNATSPNKKMILLLAIVMGLLIPTAIIYLREVMNTKVRSRRDIEDLAIPFLGEVPLADVPQHARSHSSRLKSEPTGPREILVRPHAKDITNEAFRMIRTNIDFMGSMNHRQNSESGRTIMVVSLNAGSGKTFVSLNTASIFAIKNKKTILVDLDLRKGTVSQNAGSPRKGIVDYLIGKETNLDNLIVKNIEGIENFDLLPEGLTPPNPTELLYSPNLEKLVDELRERYDYVVFDCPPIEIVADARLLNPYIDMTIFVMRSGLFEKSDLKVLRQLYDSHRYNNLALILNATDSVHGIYGNYGYGYGYHSSSKRKHKK